MNETPTPEASGAAEVAETVINVAGDVFVVARDVTLGVLAGLIVSVLVVMILRLGAHRRVMWGRLAHHCRSALHFLGASAGAYISFQLTAPSLAVQGHAPGWVSMIAHSLLVLTIAAATWLLVCFLRALEESVVSGAQEKGPAGRANRVTTQAQVLRRVASAVVVICGLVGAIMTFPAARVAMGSLLASAGIISVVAGLAAQSMLGNVFAGLQLAMTDAIRVDDVVVVDTGEQGVIEEITLSYVVVKTWDERRIILPSKYFTERPFANWSRRGTQIIGDITLCLDWRVPVAALRAQLHTILASNSDWDGREATVVVLDTSTHLVTVRVALSAGDHMKVGALKTYVREEILAWLQREHPEALPRTRIEINNVEVTADPTDEKVARLAEELMVLSQGRTEPPTDSDGLMPGQGPIETAKVRAASWRASAARRKRREKRSSHEHRRISIVARAEHSAQDATRVLPPATQSPKESQEDTHGADHQR